MSGDRFAPLTRENPSGFLTREFTITAERAGDGDDAPLRIAISSEAPVERWSWDPELRDSGGYYDEVLDHSAGGVDLSYVRDGIPFLLDHRLSAQIGIGTTPILGADGVLRTDVTRGNHPDAAWVFADMAAGVRKKVSIGYWPGTNFTQTKDAKTGRIIRTYRGWGLFESSTVVVPADYEMGVGRSARGAANPQGTDHAAGDEPHTKESSMSATATAPEPGTAPAPDTRAAELAVLAREAGMPERAAVWITENTSVATARSEVLVALREKAEQRQPIHQGADVIVTGVKERAEDKPWEGAAEFFRAVVKGRQEPHNMDVRLRAQNTSVGTEGGFTVPPAIVTVLLEAQKTGGEILSRVTNRPITTGNSLKETLIKEEARTNGSRNGGLRAYWIAQEGDITLSSAKTRELELNLKKISAAVSLTEEQLEDGPAMLSFLQEQVPDEMKFQKELAIWGANGSGCPLGFMSSGALITQAIESTQTIANTSEFIWKNAAKMMTRMNPSAFLRSAFFINPALWADVVTATAGAASNGATTLFTPPGRLEGAPFGAIYGRPLVPVEYASAVGTVGDFVLADLSDYLWAQKGGIRTAQSIHVDFLKEKQTLRFTERVDGQPRTNKPMTPLNGSVTVSPYVALAGRS